MHKCLSGTGSSIQMSSSNGAVGSVQCSSSSSSSSSSSTSSSSRWHSGRNHWWGQTIHCSTSEECSVLSWSGLVSGDKLSSSLNDKWQHIELRLLCWWGECVQCVSGVAGLKDKVSPYNAWYRHGVLCRGVGIFKLSLPLSQPSSSRASSHSKASFRVVIKWPNNTSSDILLNCWAELLQKKGCVNLFNGIPGGLRL